MSGLGLVPNVIIGWRIKPDYYNFTVCIVKRYGASSKKAGQEYEESLAYCKTLDTAVFWLINHVTRVEAERHQDDIAAVSGSIASAQGMLAAMKVAQTAALKAVADLTARLAEAGLKTPKHLVSFLDEKPTEQSH